METAFRAAQVRGSDWKEAAEACLAALAPLPEGANLGFIYATEPLARELPGILDMLREGSGVADWVGSVALGVCATGQEYYDEPALVALVGAFPKDSYRIFGPEVTTSNKLAEANGAWLEKVQPMVGIVHGDPRQPTLPETVESLSREASLFFMGGLSSARSSGLKQVAGGGLVEGGVSGVLLAPQIEMVTGLTQGCSPIGPVRRATSVRGGVLMELDGRPALDCLKEDIGELLSRDLRKIGGLIFAGLPVRGSDTGDYMVRNLVAIDAEKGWVQIADDLAPGDPVLFCRRDPRSATIDMERMLTDLKRRAGGPPKAGLYFTCVARGPNIFGDNSGELGMIRDVLGDFPLVGFFGNGEISHDRLYGYTGVLALFV